VEGGGEKKEEEKTRGGLAGGIHSDWFSTKRRFGARTVSVLKLASLVRSTI
jgi:hypothetical protein